MLLPNAHVIGRRPLLPNVHPSGQCSSQRSPARHDKINKCCDSLPAIVTSPTAPPPNFFRRISDAGGRRTYVFKPLAFRRRAVAAFFSDTVIWGRRVLFRLYHLGLPSSVSTLSPRVAELCFASLAERRRILFRLCHPGSPSYFPTLSPKVAEFYFCLSRRAWPNSAADCRRLRRRGP